MQALKIVFKTTDAEDMTDQQIEEMQKKNIQEILPLLIAGETSFQFYQEWDNHRYTSFNLIIKYYWDETIKEVQSKIQKMDGVVFSEYSVCEREECYKEVVMPTETLPCFLLNRHGEGDSLHQIHVCCKEHAGLASHKLIETLETIDETPGEKDHWAYIHIWKWPLFWVAQRVWQEWDYGDYEAPHSWPYLAGSPWLCGKTKEEAIERARAYRA